MIEYDIIRLERFKGGLHLARGLTNTYDKTLDRLHSDTLKSALFVCALQLYGEEALGGEAFLKRFNISSAFPFFASMTSGRTLYFFPRPESVKLPFEIAGMEEGKEKKLKKVRYIEQRLFERLLRGEQRIALKPQDFHGPFVASSEDDLGRMLEAEDCEAIMKTTPYQHVFIPRGHEGDSQPYYVDKIFFHQQAGLFFLLHADDDETRRQVKAAMRLLADSGIGTDRNVGNGQFSWAHDTLALNVPERGDMDLNLSIYCPAREEVADGLDKAYYGLVKRGGYISSPEDEANQSIRKRSVYMFTEGSLFPRFPNRMGKIVDLKPIKYTAVEHPIWRDGRAIFVPFKTTADEH